jgi:hypothetical protein
MTLFRKPVSIVLVGVFYLVAPVFNLVQIALVTGVGFVGPVTLWTVVGPYDWAVLVAFPVVGWGMLSVRRWGWLAFMVFSVFLVGYNTAGLIVNQTYDVVLVMLFNVVLVLITFVFFRKHLRAPYFNPRLRWWNTDPRYQVNLVAHVGIDTPGACEAEVLDLSASGAFLSTCADIEVGQVQRFTIEAYGLAFPVQGKVMRKSDPGASHPGFGVMFQALDRSSVFELRLLLARLVKNGARERGLPADAPTGGDPCWKHLAWQGKRLVNEFIGS